MNTTRAASTGFLALAGLHVVWATGSSWPLSDEGELRPDLPYPRGAFRFGLPLADQRQLLRGLQAPAARIAANRYPVTPVWPWASPTGFDSGEPRWRR